MRSEILHLTSERDHSHVQLQESERRLQLLQDDLQSTKQRLNKAQQANMQLERDYRAAQSVVNTLQGSVNMDVDYYKRKVSLTYKTT